MPSLPDGVVEKGARVATGEPNNHALLGLHGNAFAVRFQPVDLENWLTHNDPRLRRVFARREVAEHSLKLARPRSHDVDFGKKPSGDPWEDDMRVLIDLSGIDFSPLRIHLSGTLPFDIVGSPEGDLRLEFVGGSPSIINFSGGLHDDALGLTNWFVLRLPHPTDQLWIHRANVDISGSVNGVVTALNCGIRSNSSGASDTKVGVETLGIVAMKDSHFDGVETLGWTKLKLVGSTVIDRLTGGAAVELDGGGLTIRNQGDPFPGMIKVGKGTSLDLPNGSQFDNLEIYGLGQVRVHGGLQSSALVDVMLSVDSAAFAVDISGAISSLDVGSGASVVGTARGEPLEPRSLGKVELGSLENVSVHSLGLLDLPALDRLQSFSIRTSPSTSERFGQANRMKPSVVSRRQTAAHDESTERIARAFFWDQISKMLGKKGAHGDVQSRARSAAAEMRRQVAHRGGREWLLLTLYKLVGYGESIRAPLYWHVFLSFGFVGLMQRLGVGIHPAGSPEALYSAFGAFWQVLISPLAFFRFVERPAVDPPLAGAVLIGVSVLGVLLLFFALSAARRVAKAE